MAEPEQVEKKRPWTIWAISIYFLYDGAGPILTPFVLQSGFQLPPPLVIYAERMFPLDYFLFFLVGGICIYGAVALLRLQKIATYILPVGGAARMLLNLWVAMTKFEVGTMPSRAWVGISVGLLVQLGFLSLLFLYLMKLSKKGILS